MSERDWDLMNEVIEYIGAEELATQLCRWLDSDTMNNWLGDIAVLYGMYDDIEEE